MENLVGKTILVGKEPGTGKLLLSVKDKGINKTKSLDVNVPNSVSRCFPEKDVAHCKIDVMSPDHLVIRNTKSPNKTFVDNQEILEKHIKRNSKVELGADHFCLDVNKILTSAIQLVKPIVPSGNPFNQVTTDKPVNEPVQKPNQQAYSLVHLKPVWEEYEQGIKEAKKQHEKVLKTRQLVQRLIWVVGPVSAGAVQFADKNIVVTLIVLCVVTGLGFLVTSFIKDPSVERIEELDEMLNKKYICPNPNCQYPFGKVPYSTLSHKMKCSNCPAKFINNITIEQE